MTSTVNSRPETTATRRPRASVRVIERAIDILFCFDETNEKLTLQEISDRTRLHKATAFRILSTLVEDGLIDQSSPGGSYELGFFALGRADAILKGSPLRQMALPIMLQLRDELEETVVLAERYGNFIMNVDKVVRREGLVETPTIGVATPLHESPAGLAILSTFKDSDMESYVKDVGIDRTPSLVRALRERVRRAKTSIASPSKASELEPVLAVPIFDRQGQAVAGLVAAVPMERIEPRTVRHCLGRLLWASRYLKNVLSV